MKFKILPKVHGLRLKGLLYKPGDIVDLPETYQGESWLKQIDTPIAAEKPLANLNQIVPADVSSLNHDSPSKRAKTKKRASPNSQRQVKTEQRGE